MSCVMCECLNQDIQDSWMSRMKMGWKVLILKIYQSGKFVFRQKLNYET